MDIIKYDSVTSTNTLLKILAEKNAKEGTVIISKAQTEGRGRMGRSFFSPKNTGLYMSILLRPKFNSSLFKYITPMAAVAVSDAIREISNKKTSIKWVNDIYIDEKKVCGILTEGSFKNNTADYLIVGIGINLEPPEGGFPKEIQAIAGAVFEKAPKDAFQTLSDKIIKNIFDYYSSFEKRNFIDKYIEECTFLKGKKITVNDGGKSFLAYARGTDRECRLEIIDEEGNKKYLYSGDVSISVPKE